MKFRKLILIGGWLFIFGLSAYAQTPSPTPAPKKTTPDAPQLKPADGNRYRLNPGDVIEIVYRYTPEYNQTVTIQPDGFVMLEIVGDLKVGGSTVEQARQKILENAAKRLRDPEV